jgi:hypothetical protein
MPRPSATTDNCANSGTAKTGPSSSRNGATNSAIINKIKEIYPRDTVKTLATWLKLSWKTAKNRIEGEREFSLDEVSALLHSEHGFEILSALMARAPRTPQWWRLCVPLMDLADAERMVQVVRRRTDAVIKNREETIDALETEIRRTQARAIHDPEHARPHSDALRSMAFTNDRVVAPRRR